jgi:hypothetical protein
VEGEDMKKSTAVLNAPLVSTPNYRTFISIAQMLDFVNILKSVYNLEQEKDDENKNCTDG